MFRLLQAAALLAASLFAAAPARADTIDMSTITCDALAGMSEDQIAWFLIWLDGWLAGQADDTLLDVEQLGAQIDGIAANCEQMPEMSVINAAKAYLEQ